MDVFLLCCSGYIQFLAIEKFYNERFALKVILVEIESLSQELSLNFMKKLTLVTFLTGLVALAAGPLAAAAGEVNLYSHRHYEIDKQLYADFTAATGIKVNVVQASADQLMERLKSEGANSPADLFMTADAGRLQRAKEFGLLQSVTSETLAAQVPATLRDADNQWHGMTVRSRVIVYSKDRVKASELSMYADLADPKWKGRLLATSAGSVYNQSLLAAIVGTEGREAAMAWAKGVRDNLARAPQGGDRDQARAIAAGLADIAIVNTYYIGVLGASASPADRKVAEQVAVFFPDQGGRGAHINVSGAGVTKSAKNRDNAIKLLEFLTSPAVQARFAAANHEYPLTLDYDASPELKSFGPFKADVESVRKLGEFNAAAVEIFNTVGWQ
jgi:iron(III) transport system substrate-binding protein